MTTQSIQSWYEDNQRYLSLALEEIRLFLTAKASSGAESLHFHQVEGAAANRIDQQTLAQLKQEQAEILARMQAPPALENLVRVFNLSKFERDILLLCAGMELDGDFAALCGNRQEGRLYAYPCFGLAMSILPNAVWDAFLPSGTLRAWRMLDTGQGETLMTSPLRIDERILHYLAGLDYLDERLKHFMRPFLTQEPLAPGHQAVVEQLTGFWAGDVPWRNQPVIQLTGKELLTKYSIVGAACQKIHSRAFVLNAADIPVQTVERQLMIELWQREVLLSRHILIIDCDDSTSQETQSRLLTFVERINGPIVINHRDPLHSVRRSIIRHDVKKPNNQEQYQLWQQGLSSLTGKLNGELDKVIDHFNLGAAAITAASVELLSNPSVMQDSKQTGRLLWNACRNQSRVALDDLAQRIEPMAGWDDLVLPDTQKKILRQVVAHVRQRRKVYEKWGFANKSARGMGISALLAGSSGTGKTMAAEVLSGELDLDLYKIDLSSVVSKYIGETEKNLRRVFDAAEEGSAILLFDEADALFGKRSEVKDSHDRYANIEVSYLLQRMESYTGLSILTTNLKSALDTAFLRRIRFVIQFPFPDVSQRNEIWRRIYPLATPIEDLEFDKLSRLSITGGNIRNIAMNAAFLAAEENKPVSMRHLLAATRGEYLKLEKPLTDSEIAGWITDAMNPAGH
ncbi:MAG: ATP-binding protein [Gammaproteobacteria bacterium]|nr:ATP-binding protein [Gammaproteobacteria bacterium]MDH5651353.1 ATP-binding protein [Gammaproteobacteria bacterium]